MPANILGQRLRLGAEDGRPVFAETADAVFVKLGDALGGNGLADGEQQHFVAAAAAGGERGGEFLLDRPIATDYGTHFWFANFSLFSGGRAVILVPAGRLSVSQTLPPITELSPMETSPSTDAPE